MKVRGLFYLFMLFAGAICGQQLSGINYTTKDGLPSNTLYEIIEDDDGFVWIGTDKGLVRFDGTEFKTFTTEDGLSGNEILDFYKSDNGDIYCLPYVAVPFIIRKGEFVAITEADSLEGSRLHQNTFLEKEPGIILLGAMVIENDSMYINPDFLVDNYYKKEPRVYSQMKDGRLVIQGVQDDYEYFSHKDYIFQEREVPEIKIWRKYVNTISRSPVIHGLLQSQYEGELEKVNTQAKLFNSMALHLKDSRVYHLIESDEETMWFCTSQDLKCVRHQNYQLQKVESLLQGVCVYSMKDSKGGLWVSTHGKGLFYYPNTEIRLKYYRNQKDFTDILINDQREVVSLRDGSILDIRKNDTLTYRSKYDAYDGFTKKLVDHKKSVYLVNDSGPLSLLREDGSMRRFDTPNGILPGENKDSVNLIPIQHAEKLIVREVPYIREGDKGRKREVATKSVWVKNDTSVYVGYEYPVVLREHGAQYMVNKMARHTFPKSIRGYRDTVIWGTSLGVVKTTADSMFCVHCKVPLLRGMIQDIQVVGDHILYATRDKGIVMEYQGKYKVINLESGLSSNDIKELILEGDSAIWAIAANGLNLITNWKGRPLISHLNENNGLSTFDITGGCIYQDTLWLSTNNGINYFNTKTIELQPQVFPVKFEGITVNGKELEDVEKLKDLKYDQNNLNIRYVGINYKNGGEIIYEYRLQGMTDSWSKTDQRQLNFPALPTGSYALEVRAIAGNHEYSKIARLPIHIHTPYWRTVWFIALVVIVIVGVSVGVVYWRYRRILARNKMINDLEIRNLRAQMNPHFLFNAMVSLETSINDRDFDSAKNYVVRFSRLMRQILDSTRNEMVVIHKEMDSLDFYLQLESDKANGKFSYTISMDEIDPELLIPPMLLQPFLENSIHHGLLPLKGRKGELKVDLQPYNEHFLVCEIMDNGIGRKASGARNREFRKGHKSVGVSVTAERLQKHSSRKENWVEYTDLFDENGDAYGTKVRILIPFEDWDA